MYKTFAGLSRELFKKIQQLWLCVSEFERNEISDSQKREEKRRVREGQEGFTVPSIGPYAVNDQSPHHSCPLSSQAACSEACNRKHPQVTV